MKYVDQLTKYQFLDKIYNYELNPQELIYLGKIPSIVVFSSPQNNFCVELEPALEVIAKRHKGKYNVYYVNTVEEPELATIFTINNVPVIYLWPMKGTPTVVKETINIKELTQLADKILTPEY